MSAAPTYLRPVDRVLARLDGARPNGPSQWEARCPAHEDRSPSLAVSEGDDGRALVFCHAGCPTSAVLAALGLSDRDLFADERPPERPQRRREVARYRYVDEAGELLYEVVRTDPKGFFQRPANGRTGAGSMKGVRRVLYRLPEVLAAVAEGRPVWITEGEKDADALARLGEVATCNAGGAGKWSTVPDAADVLTGAEVFVWVDDDSPGHAHGRDVVRSIDGKAAGWTVLRSTTAKDASEHLGRGDPLDALDGLAVSDGDRSWLAADGRSDDADGGLVGDVGSDISGHLTDEVASCDDGPTSWARIDVVAALRDGGPPPPEVLAHRRGHRLLYRGRTHAFFGASESLKSWAAQLATAETLMAGGSVFYVDYEDDETGVGARLVALGVDEATIPGQLHYVRPDEPLVDGNGRWTRAGLEEFLPALEHPWRLAVVDGLTEAMTVEGLDIGDNADAARFARRLLRPLAGTGAAVVALDHQPKNATETARYAIGAQHKLSGLTGAAYRFETLRRLGRPEHEPVIGTTKITVSKDRPGYVRGRARDGVAGILTVTAWPDGKVDAEVVDPADLGDDGADMELVRRVLEHLDTYDGASKNQLEESVTGKRDGIRAAVGWLIGKGWVRVEKEGQAHRHYLTDDGRREVPNP